MSSTLPTSSDDDSHSDIHHLQPKKERKIEPISSSSSYGIPGYGVPAASEDLLAELRRKTAELADEMAAERKSDEQKKPHTKQHEQKAPKIDAKTETFLEELKVVDPEHPDETSDKDNGAETETSPTNPAIALVRDKVSRIYAREPSAQEEAKELQQLRTQRSKHQQFMYDLTTSGKSLADIQTEWHNYYIHLSDHEKHEVWQEFYEAQRPTHSATGHQRHHQTEHAEHSKRNKLKNNAHAVGAHPKNLPRPGQFIDQRSVGEIKSQLLNKISANGKLTAVHHFKSLLFGLGMSALVLLFITFIFFNEAYIAPFISPNQSVSATPIIGTQDGPVGPEPKIIIPKINLEVPVVFGMQTVEENDIQTALEDGVVHYASTPNPGEVGNSVIVGHSSNNILNKGKYKFAFVLLKRLEAEDTFFVHREGVRYTYKVYKKEIVSPDNTAVLNTQEKPNTITLITCDPPGTSVNRLIITAEQIAPDPISNKASTAISELKVEEQKLPSNAPSLWSRLWPF